MGAAVRRLLIALLCVSVAAHGSEPVCYQYRFDVSSSFLDPYNTWKNTEGEVAAAWTAACTQSEGAWESPGCANYSPGSGVGTFDVTIGTGGGCSYKQLTASWTRGAASNTRTTCMSRQVVECPEDPCVDAMELAAEGLGVGANVEASGRLCSADDGEGGAYSGGLYGKGCEVIKDGAGIASSDGGHWYGQIKYTGQSCPASDTPDPLQSDANCLTLSGVKHCVSKTTKSCGSVNGQRVCLDDVPPGSCMLLTGGGAVCDGDSDDGPKDEMGNPLEPTSTVSDTSGGTSTDTPGTTKTYNYYSASVIEESYTPVPGTDGDDDEGGDSGGEEPGACTEEDCEGEIPDDLEELDSFGEITQAFMDRVAESDLVASVSSLGTSVPTGSCPDWDIEVFGEEISLSAPMCTIWGSVSGLLSAVMLIAWGLLAARIVLSA